MTCWLGVSWLVAGAGAFPGPKDMTVTDQGLKAALKRAAIETKVRLVRDLVDHQSGGGTRYQRP